MVVCKVVLELLKGWVTFDVEAVPECPFGVTVLLLWWSDRVREAEERKSEVDKRIVVLFNVLGEMLINSRCKLQTHLLLINDFEQFQAN